MRLLLANTHTLDQEVFARSPEHVNCARKQEHGILNIYDRSERFRSIDEVPGEAGIIRMIVFEQIHQF